MTKEATPAVPAVPAVPATPAVPAVPAVVAPPTIDPVKVEVAPVTDSGDAALDVALTFFAKAGLGRDSAAIKAAADGDFSFLEAALAEKGVQGWETHVKLAKEAETRIKGAAAVKVAAAKDAILKAVGGEEKWAVIREWAGANATKDEMAQLNAAFRQGGLVARTAAEYVARCYANANPSKPSKALKPGAGGTPPASGALSKDEYLKEVDALAKKIGGQNLTSSPEYRNLNARRRAHRG